MPILFYFLFLFFVGLTTSSFAVEKSVDSYSLEKKVTHLVPQKKINGKYLLDVLLISATQENIYYCIEHDYDLGAKELIVPRGCVLAFVGGSISNGTLNAQGATLEAPITKIFSTDVTLNGLWNNDNLPVEWYGAVGDNKTDCTSAINAAINNTSIYAVSLLAGAKYEITSSIRMRSSGLAFGCFEVAYSHEDSPAAYIYSNCSDDILQFPTGVKVAGVNLKGVVLYKRWKHRYNGDGIHIENASMARCCFDGVRVYYCNNGFYQYFAEGYKGYTLNKMQNCVFSGCRYGFRLTHDKGGKFSYWCNLNNWDNCHFGFNLLCGLWIQNVYSCEQNLFNSCGFEGVSMDENTTWNGDSDICAVKLNGQGYGLTTFLNCYFERNHPKHAKIKATATLNEQTPYCVADVIVEGALVSFDKSTFNDGITPVVIRDGKIGITVRDCIFRAGYNSNCMVMFKSVKPSNMTSGNYFIFDVPYIEKRYSQNPIKNVDCSTKALSTSIRYLTVVGE